MSRGQRNTARGCVAVGVQGNLDAAGFVWPEGSEGLWSFVDCVTHNSLNGIFVWQNTGNEHVIADFVAYHNHGAGIDHGAYGNPFHYRDSILHGNSNGAVLLHAVSSDTGLRFTNLICFGAGESEYLVESARHPFSADRPTGFFRCRFAGARTAAFGLTYEGDDGPGEPDHIEIVDCSFDGNEFWLAEQINPRSELRVSNGSQGVYFVRRHDQDGEFNSDWNARVTR